jgi:hypothetical protein
MTFRIEAGDFRSGNLVVAALLIGAVGILRHQPGLASVLSNAFFRPKMWVYASGVGVDDRLIEALKLAAEFEDIYPGLDLAPTLHEIETLAVAVLSENDLVTMRQPLMSRRRPMRVKARPLATG